MLVQTYSSVVNNLGANICLSQFNVVRLCVVRVNTRRCRIISERQTRSSTPVKVHTDMVRLKLKIVNCRCKYGWSLAHTTLFPSVVITHNSQCRTHLIRRCKISVGKSLWKRTPKRAGFRIRRNVFPYDFEEFDLLLGQVSFLLRSYLKSELLVS
jgi:hypothetical protein